MGVLPSPPKDQLDGCQVPGGTLKKMEHQVSRAFKSRPQLVPRQGSKLNDEREKRGKKVVNAIT